MQFSIFLKNLCRKFCMPVRVVFALVIGVAPASKASIIWDWNFAGEAGQFITDGSLSGGLAQFGFGELVHRGQSMFGPT